MKFSAIRKSLTRSTALKIIATAMLILVVIIWLSWQFISSQTSAYPLGDKLQYTGKQDYGCPFICDSGPHTQYIYTTDMTPRETAAYFKKADVSSTSDFTPIKGDDLRFFLDFKNKNNSKPFSLSYSLTNSDSLTLYIDSKDYETAKASL